MGAFIFIVCAVAAVIGVNVWNRWRAGGAWRRERGAWDDE